MTTEQKLATALAALRYIANMGTQEGCGLSTAKLHAEYTIKEITAEATEIVATTDEKAAIDDVLAAIG